MRNSKLSDKCYTTVTSRGFASDSQSVNSQHMNNKSRWVSGLLALAFCFAMFSAKADAPTDITGVISAVSGYVTAGIVVGVAILLWVLGRRTTKKVV